MKAWTFRALALAVLPAIAPAQTTSTYPDRPIRVVVPYAPGGPSDAMARIVGQKLSDSLKQSVIIDNKPGGNTLIGAMDVLRSKPDGYTLFFTDASTQVLNPHLYTTLPYDPKDFEPVSKVATVPNIIVTTANGPKTMKALIEQARANPGKLSYGFGATVTQLGGFLLKTTFDLNLIEVPYKGGALVVQGLLANDVTFTVDASTANLQHIETGRLVAVANLSDVPVPGLPNLPKVSDTPGGGGFSSAGWNAFYAPKSTPPAVINQLNREIVRILALPDVKEKLAAQGIVADPSTPAELRAFVESESKKWKPIIEKSGIPKIN